MAKNYYQKENNLIINQLPPKPDQRSQTPASSPEVRHQIRHEASHKPTADGKNNR